MKVRFFGTRGSVPTPISYQELLETFQYMYEEAFRKGIKPADLPVFLKKMQQEQPFFFGGDTSCVLFSEGDRDLIVDAGSGLRRLGGEQLKKGNKEMHVLLSHFHWDHIQGIPFFVPVYIPGLTINIYAAQDELEQIMKKQMSHPTFPIPFDVLRSKVIFHKLEEGKLHKINDFKVEVFKLHHPNPCYGFKVSKGEKSAVYFTDTEIKATELLKMDSYRAFIGNTQAVIADAQYSFVDYYAKQTWGHSTVITFIDMLAAGDNVDRLIMFHHEPMAGFVSLMEQYKDAVNYKKLNHASSKLQVLISWDGMELQL